MRCARATRRSAAVAAARCRPLHRQPLCLDGFTAIHRRDYYPPGCLRLSCVPPPDLYTTPPPPSLSLSLSLLPLYPSILSFPPFCHPPPPPPSSAKPLSAPFLFRSLRYIVAEVGRDGRSRNNDNNADTRQRHTPHPPRRRTEFDARTHTNTYLAVTRA